MRRILSIVLIMFCFCVVRGQEFRCTVTINPQKLMTTTQPYETTDKKVFDNMRQALEDLVNGRRWTTLDMEPQERIECSMQIILSQRTSATDFSGQITMQLKRPVWGSTYTTGLFNFIEQNNLAFSYNENQSLDFDPNNFTSVLSSVTAYYCYIMLGLYFDSFAPNGGEPFYQMAQQVVQAVDAAQYSGWDSKSARNRYWFMENHTNSAYEGLHNAYYTYHRLGLDMMTKDQAQARAAIIASLETIQQVNQTRNGLLSVQQFVDVKTQEIISIFTPAPAEEKQKVYDIVRAVSPMAAQKMRIFNKK